MRRKKEEDQAMGKALALLLAAALPWMLLGAWCFGGKEAAPASGNAEISETTAPEKLIALTFDDGPSPVNTPVLLEGLAQRGIHATFFLVGSMVENSPEQVERMAREGHQIGIHTYDHQSSTGLLGLTQAQFDAQVGTTRAMLTQITGQTQFALRPPYGYVDDGVRQRAPGPIILWSIDPEDWKYQDTQKVAQHIVSHAQDGAVILLHDIFATSVEAALQAVDTLQAQGYRFVTVDELFQAKGIELRQGEDYRCAVE